jgi:hypothetical protein
LTLKQFIKASLLSLVVVASVVGSTTSALAENTDPPHNGHITGRSVVAGLLSLIIWPGIGQAVNADRGSKVATHAIVGLLPPFRFYSGYDALVNRKGGYFNGKV